VIVRCAPLVATLLAVGGCSSIGSWTYEDCPEGTLELVDHAIAEAVSVENYVQQAIDDEYGDRYARYEEVLDELIRVRSRDRIRCARLDDASVPEEGQPAGVSYGGANIIGLNLDAGWPQWTEEFHDGRTYGDLPLAEIPDLVAAMDLGEFDELRAQAYDYLVTPAQAAGSLVHEAAHLEVPGCCHHTIENPAYDERDFVNDVGYWARSGIYWERWTPESQWLDQLFWASHQGW